MVIEANDLTIFLVFVITFAFTAMFFSYVDWSKLLKQDKKQTWIAVGLWMILSFAAAAMITFGIFMIGGITSW